MTGVFRQKNPGNILVVFLLGILLKIPSLFSGASAVVRPQDGVLYQRLIGFLHPFAQVFSFTYPVLAFLLIFLQAALLTRFINDHRLMNRANYFPGMSLMLLSSLLPDFNGFAAPLVAAVFLLYIFIQLFKAYTQKFSKRHIYNSGLLLGISSLFFFPSIFFIIWIFISLARLRPFKLNEWLLLLIGLLTPYYFYGIFLFLNDSWSWQNLYPGITFSVPPIRQSLWLAGAFFVALMPLLAGLYHAQSHAGRMLVHIRKCWMLFAFYIVVGFFISFFNVGKGLENLVIVLAPVAAYHAYGYFYAEWKPFAPIAFWLSVLFIIARQVAGV